MQGGASRGGGEGEGVVNEVILKKKPFYKQNQQTRQKLHNILAGFRMNYRQYSYESIKKRAKPSLKTNLRQATEAEQRN